MIFYSPHGTEWEAETYEEALEMERDSLFEQLEGAHRRGHALGWQEAEREIAGLKEQLEATREALREACLHQGLPEDAPPERIAKHFRGNREMAEGFRALADSNPAKRPT